MQKEIWRFQNYNIKTMMHNVKKAWYYAGVTDDVESIHFY